APPARVTFVGPRAHRSLDSFPTRRSSDLATFAGLAVAIAGLEVWSPLLTSIRMLGEISIPLMLFALGARLADSTIAAVGRGVLRSEEHTSELQSRENLVCRLLLEKKHNAL